MKRSTAYVLVTLLGLGLSCSPHQATGEKLREWRRGVWLLSGGGYTIYTNSHYFVVSVSGDSSQANVYCGGSQLRITDKGIARRQTLRIRQLPGGALRIADGLYSLSSEERETLELDMTQFQPGSCNVHDGVIYDSVTEETEHFILLSTCNGDREKIFSDGRSVYLPATGGEFWARRVESW